MKLGKQNSIEIHFAMNVTVSGFQSQFLEKIFVNVTLDCYYYFISYKNGYTIVQNNFKKLIV